jgi:hypothetical protein
VACGWPGGDRAGGPGMKKPRGRPARDLDRLSPSSSRRAFGDPLVEGARSAHGTNTAPSSSNGRSPLWAWHPRFRGPAEYTPARQPRFAVQVRSPGSCLLSRGGIPVRGVPACSRRGMCSQSNKPADTSRFGPTCGPRAPADHGSPRDLSRARSRRDEIWPQRTSAPAAERRNGRFAVLSAQPGAGQMHRRAG